MARRAKRAQTLEELQAVEEAKQLADAAKRLEVQGVYLSAQIRYLGPTPWTTYREVPTWHRMPPTTTDVTFAHKWVSSVNWAVGLNDRHKPLFAVDKTPLEIAERTAKLGKRVDAEITDRYWSFDALSTVLRTLRAEDERQVMQDKLVAAGRVVPVERLAKVEAERQHDHAEYRAHLEQEHVANNDFKQQMLESQKVILSNQRKLETRSIKLARRVEHLSAKKVGAGEDDNDAESHDNAEDSHSQLSWRPSRADPSTPTPSSSRRRRPLPTEASSPSSSASSRPELALAPPLARLSSTRPSTSAHQTAAYSVPSPGPSSSTEHVRSRRRSAFTLASGSSMAQYGADDVFGNMHAEATPAAASREGSTQMSDVDNQDDWRDEGLSRDEHIARGSKSQEGKDGGRERGERADGEQHQQLAQRPIASHSPPPSPSPSPSSLRTSNAAAHLRAARELLKSSPDTSSRSCVLKISVPLPRTLVADGPSALIDDEEASSQGSSSSSDDDEEVSRGLLDLRLERGAREGDHGLSSSAPAPRGASRSRSRPLCEDSGHQTLSRAVKVPRALA